MAVRVRRGHDRAEVAVVERVGVRGPGQEADVLALVVADRELVRSRALLVALKEAVHLAAVVLVAAAVPAVVGIAKATALEVGREVMRGMAGAVEPGIGEAGVLGVGGGVPAEVVIEGAVLHHQDDERVDRQVARLRERLSRRPLGRLGDQRLRRQHGRHPGQPGDRCRALEELAPAQVLVAILGLEALADAGVGVLAREPIGGVICAAGRSCRGPPGRVP